MLPASSILALVKRKLTYMYDSPLFESFPDFIIGKTLPIFQTAAVVRVDNYMVRTLAINSTFGTVIINIYSDPNALDGLAFLMAFATMLDLKLLAVRQWLEVVCSNNTHFLGVLETGS